MKAVITVTGKDGVGIVASVSGLCAKYGVNIMDISQSVLQEFFVMFMIADISALTVPFTEFVDDAEEYGKGKGLTISVMHEDIFNSMHKI
ncbi:MAG: ACT domain-containing protein [Clostridia bacterium]|nr:ACT domain-containing protein [Clostridia bacterium]